MRKTPWRRIAFAAAASIFAAVVCLVAVWVAWIVIGGQARQLPFIESSVAASLIREAQAQDPSAEITSAFVACRLGPWQCYWDPSGAGPALSQELADQVLQQIVRVHGPTNVDFELACEERFDEGFLEPGYACTWDPGTGPRSLPVR